MPLIHETAYAEQLIIACNRCEYPDCTETQSTPAKSYNGTVHLLLRRLKLTPKHIDDYKLYCWKCSNILDKIQHNKPKKSRPKKINIDQSDLFKDNVRDTLNKDLAKFFKYRR